MKILNNIGDLILLDWPFFTDIITNLKKDKIIELFAKDKDTKDEWKYKSIEEILEDIFIEYSEEEA